MVELLRFQPVRCLRAPAPAVEDVDAAVRTAMAAIGPVLADMPREAPVAVTCGSRGIDRIAEVIRAACAVLREAGARPFVVPAMGSHGGATAEGQRRLIADYGVTEQLIGAPVVCSMETVPLGKTPEGTEVFMDRAAWEAGRVLAVNRIKPHTDFDGEVESGLMKILAVGLGKVEGANSFHGASLRTAFDEVLLSMGRHIVASGKVLAGLGVVENEVHRLCEIAAVPGGEVEALDRRLLVHARRLHPKLPFAMLDLLIVDEIGKNVSGAGLDTKVIGRAVHPERVPRDMRDAIRIRRIYIRDLTPESEGNAIGMGLADVMHERIARKVDLEVMYTNSRVSYGYSAPRMPMHFPSDRAAIDFLLGNLGQPAPERLRAAWIRNTLSMTIFFATPACAADLAGNADYTVGPAAPLEFDSRGDFKGGAA